MWYEFRYATDFNPGWVPGEFSRHLDSEEEFATKNSLTTSKFEASIEISIGCWLHSTIHLKIRSLGEPLKHVSISKRHTLFDSLSIKFYKGIKSEHCWTQTSCRTRQNKPVLLLTDFLGRSLATNMTREFALTQTQIINNYPYWNKISKLSWTQRCPFHFKRNVSVLREWNVGALVTRFLCNMPQIFQWALQEH